MVTDLDSDDNEDEAPAGCATVPASLHPLTTFVKRASCGRGLPSRGRGETRGAVSRGRGETRGIVDRDRGEAEAFGCLSEARPRRGVGAPRGVSRPRRRDPRLHPWKTANRILGMIKRTFCYLNREIVLQLYKSLVRPHLEYCIQAWRPHLHKDIDLMEKVQRRATKMIPSLRDKPYEVRLNRLNLTTLETRRLRGDLIEVFKIFKGFDDIDLGIFFDLSKSRTRGHCLKLFKPGCRLDCRKFAFSHRDNRC